MSAPDRLRRRARNAFVVAIIAWVLAATRALDILLAFPTEEGQGIESLFQIGSATASAILALIIAQIAITVRATALADAEAMERHALHERLGAAEAALAARQVVPEVPLR